MFNKYRNSNKETNTMNCPICGNELKPSKKDPQYVLCYSCRKKFKISDEHESIERKPDKPLRKSSAHAPKEAAALDDELTEQTQVFSRRDVRAALKKANEERKAKKAALKAAKAGIPVNSNSGNSASISEPEDDGEFHLRYANLPPKSVREKQEREMRKAYDELLSIGKEERSSKKHGLFGKRN